MRLRLALALAATTTAVAAAEPAAGAPVLEVRPGATVLREDPYLPPRSASDLPPVPRHAPAKLFPRIGGQMLRSRASARTTVRQALDRALAAGAITVEQHSQWRASYGAALRTRRGMSGPRRAQLSAVVETLEAIAASDQLTASRMPALFLQLERNTEYWPSRPYPASGQRVSFAGSSLVFQYYSGYGLQIQPLANFGKANGLWRAGRTERLRELLDELVAIGSRRGRFTTWEYWFAFGGGSPPWMSAMAQGTAIQALSRGSQLLGERSYLRVARSAIRAFSTRYPIGIRAPGRDRGNHYLIYSFAPGLRVLNAFAQTLNGLYDYATAAGHARATELFVKGERSLRAELPSYDTGAWTLYSVGGAEASAEYHGLATDFLANLCERLAAEPYCGAAARLRAYETEPPRLGIVTTRLVAGNPQYVRFRLSKRSTVRLTITRGEQLVHSAAAVAPYGTRSFAWTPSEPGEYTVTLSAESFNATRGSASGTIAVRPGS